MSNVSFSGWASIIFLLLLLAAISFSFGHYAAQAIARLSTREKRLSLRKWGVERDLVSPTSLGCFIALGIALGLGIAFFAFLAFLVLMTPFSEVSIADIVGFSSWRITLSIVTYSFVLGFAMKYQPLSNTLEKIKELDNLRGVYHQRFKVSELLAMYEGLRHAPLLFWEEYSNLPDKEVNENTNSKYLERAAPYRYSQSSRYNRIVITVAVLTLLVTAVLAAKDILT